ncbi:hypothetical protein DIPPA_55584 [Diplonema papillatum]|nr:hypothetical protein DIPPA_63036 [Diplonema papillatum]KAJ9449349.1 hypothetical protein DIPPA_55584 [Diplonema papillatum]
MPGRKRKVPTPSSDSSSSDSSSTSSEKSKKVKAIIADLLPSKSRKLYEKTYADFLSFAKIKGQPSESDILLYMHDLAEIKKLGYKTLWQRYSMIKSGVQARHDTLVQMLSSRTLRAPKNNHMASCLHHSSSFLSFFHW